MELQSTPCDRIQKPSRRMVKENDDDFPSSYNILPLYEEKIYKQNIMRNNSLQANELLKCRWNEYKNSFSQKIMSSFYFPESRDDHFYMQKCRYAPSQTNKNRDYRYKVGMGPGVDHLGHQKPIPNEALMKRGNGKDSRNPIKNKTEKK